MTDKELRRMGRGDLIEIIYQYQKREQELMEENAALQRRLEDRRINIEKAGSIAEAALYLNHIFESAQAAADHYLEEVRASGSERGAGREADGKSQRRGGGSKAAAERGQTGGGGSEAAAERSQTGSRGTQCIEAGRRRTGSS